MNDVLSLINTYPSPYSDLAVVFVLFVFFYLVAFAISRFAEAEKTGPEIAPTQDMDLKEDDTAETLKSDLQGMEEPPTLEEVPAAEKTPPEQVQPVPDLQVFRAPQTLSDQRVEVDEADTATEDRSQYTVRTYRKPADEADVTTEDRSEKPQEKKLPSQGAFSKLVQGLSRTNTGFLSKLENILSGKEVAADLWDELEELLILSDIGMTTTMNLRDRIEASVSKRSLSDPGEIRSALQNEILHILQNAEGTVEVDHKPMVMIVVGVNGVGKTTTIGKLADKFVNKGYKVMVAACDTFRAAATEQLQIWSTRVGSELIKGSSGADPSAVAFDALSASRARGVDILIIDTAGRLHTKTNLMDELKKIKRVVGREMQGAPHEVLMVLDATTGQNALQQAKMFNEAVGVTGVALTKLDGTAKGGVIVAIADDLKIPVKYIGIGESLDDLREFNAKEFTEALFFSSDETIH